MRTMHVFCAVCHKFVRSTPCIPHKQDPPCKDLNLHGGKLILQENTTSQDSLSGTHLTGIVWPNAAHILRTYF
jgi:hypothetical protein